MILVNAIADAETMLDAGALTRSELQEVFQSLTLLLAPFAPYLAAELWEALDGQGAVLRQSWPVANPALAREDRMEIPVQINGKLVTVVTLAAESDDESIKSAAMSDAKVSGRLAGRVPTVGRAPSPHLTTLLAWADAVLGRTASGWLQSDEKNWDHAVEVFSNVLEKEDGVEVSEMVVQPV